MRLESAKWLGGVSLFVVTFGTNVCVGSTWVDEKLKAFQTNPKAFINDQKNVSKYDPETQKPIQIQPMFSAASIQSRDFVLQKDMVQNSSKAAWVGRADILNNDRAENLVDVLQVDTLQGMEKANLMSSTLPESPWSDDYWAIYKGLIAKRYSDPNFPNSTDWAANVKYIANSSCSLNQLSPAEKYDLLVGDRNWTLTKAMVAEGQGYYNASGKVETWMGICHGWAPASFMTLRPTRGISVLAADGRNQITFYPSDIKALSSLLWAKASPKARLIGGRCNQKSPQEDPNGRILAQDCFDTNPGTWHLSVVNQLGVSKRSFVLDATYDYEVWNQPAYSYQYSYFNPQAFVGVDSFEKAIVRRSDFSNDKFPQYRSKNAAYIVGIAMKFIYIAETSPSTNILDSPKNDRKIAVNYLYDVELDKDFKIIGGEWYHRQHPDFLWVPQQGAYAVSVGDEFLSRPENAAAVWNGSTPFPALWTQAAQGASQKGQPLARVVNTLVTLSHLGN